MKHRGSFVLPDKDMLTATSLRAQRDQAKKSFLIRVHCHGILGELKHSIVGCAHWLKGFCSEQLKTSHVTTKLVAAW